MREGEEKMFNQAFRVSAMAKVVWRKQWSTEVKFPLEAGTRTLSL